MRSAVPSSGPKNKISGFPYRSTSCSLMPGLWPGMRRSTTACQTTFHDKLYISRIMGGDETHVDVFLEAQLRLRAEPTFPR